MSKYIFVFLLNFSFFAQVKGIVVDPKNKPIAYVSIWVENEEIGTTSEENGTFNLADVALTKTLIFSAIGYETQKVKVSEAEKVVLNEVIYLLEEIAISNPLKKEEITVGNFDKKTLGGGFGNNKSPHKMAKFFPNTSQIELHHFIKEIIFQTRTKNKNAKIGIQFYEANSEGSPGKSLLVENFVFNLKKGTKLNKVNIEHLKLSFPEKGLFVSFEWMLIDDNFSTYSYSKKGETAK